MKKIRPEVHRHLDGYKSRKSDKLLCHFVTSQDNSGPCFQYFPNSHTGLYIVTCSQEERLGEYCEPVKKRTHLLVQGRQSLVLPRHESPFLFRGEKFFENHTLLPKIGDHARTLS